MARPNFTAELRSGAVTKQSAGNWPGGAVTTYSGILTDRCVESASGTNRKSPKGFKPPAAYTFQRRKYTASSGFYNVISQMPSGNLYNHFKWDGDVFGADTEYGFSAGLNSVYTPQGVPQSMIDRALIKARLNLKQQDVNLGVAFAERNRTARLMGDTCLQLANAYRYLRRGQWQKAARELGLHNPKKPRGSSVPQKWLELQYGWKPLLSDVYGSCQALAKLDRHDWRVTAKGTISEPIDVRGDSYDSVDREDLQIGSGRAVGIRGCFVRIDAVPANELMIRLAALGLLNPLEIAWELVPFSFIVDWALPIGDYLQSLDAMLGYSQAYCSISTLERYSNSFTLEDTPPFDPGGSLYTSRWVIRRGASTEEYIRLNRTVPANVPLPTMPRIKDPSSLGHMANGLALLSQVFGGR